MLFESARSIEARAYIHQLLSTVKPGGKLPVVAQAFLGIENLEHNGSVFGAVDRIMGSIIGASYEWSCEDLGRILVFRRRLTPLPDGPFRTYVAPDRRHQYSQLECGIWRYRDSSELPPPDVCPHQYYSVDLPAASNVFSPPQDETEPVLLSTKVVKCLNCGEPRTVLMASEGAY